MDAARQQRRVKSHPLHLSFTAIVLFLAGLMWVTALGLPVFITRTEVVLGYWVFAMGWMGFAFLQFAWYANLLMLLSIALMYRSPLMASLIAGVGMLIATQAFWFESVPVSTVDALVREYGLGFWLWYGSIITLGIAVFFGNDYVAPDEDQHLAKLEEEAASFKQVLLEPVNKSVPASSSKARETTKTLGREKLSEMEADDNTQPAPPIVNAVLLAELFKAKAIQENEQSLDPKKAANG